MTFLVLLGVLVAFVVIYALTPKLPALRTPGALVNLARAWDLDLHAAGAAGWDGPLFLRIELQPSWRRFRRRWDAEVRVRAPGMDGLSIRARRPTDLRVGLQVDHGRLDEAVRVDADDPADALSRLDAPARTAVMRAVGAGAELAGGEWKLTKETDGRDLDHLLRTLVTPARALSEVTGDVDTRLSLLARHDPVLEVRVVCAARRAERGGLGRWEAPRLVDVLRDGVNANPPIPGASQALARLQAVRAKTEAGRVSLAVGSEGQLSLAPVVGGEVSFASGPLAAAASAPPEEE
jgi:hypothetical protein